MLNKKNLLVICGFFTLCLSIIYYALNMQRSGLDNTSHHGTKSAEVSFFKKVYFYRSFEHTPNLILESNDLLIEANNNMTFTFPKGMFYSKGKEYRYEADDGFMNQIENYLNLKGNVRLSGENSDYASDEISYYGKDDILDAKGNVSSQLVDIKTLDIIKLKSETMKSFVSKNIVELHGNVRGDLKRKRIYEGGVKFSAETVIFNSLNSEMDLTKDVKMHRNNYYLRSGKAQIFLQNFNKKLKYYVLYDDVKLEEKLETKDTKAQVRKAFAEKLEGIESSGAIILTGAPRVEQGNDVIKGYQITLRENSELVEVDDAQSSFRVQKD